MTAVGHKGRLRSRMRERDLSAGIRTLGVRGSGYIGKGVNGIYPLLIEQPLRKGKPAWITGDLDVPHTFTVNVDMARALVTLASEERAWGRAWHVPVPACHHHSRAGATLRRRGGLATGQADPAAAFRDAHSRADRADGP